MVEPTRGVEGVQETYRGQYPALVSLASAYAYIIAWLEWFSPLAGDGQKLGNFELTAHPDAGAFAPTRMELEELIRRDPDRRLYESGSAVPLERTVMPGGDLSVGLRLAVKAHFDLLGKLQTGNIKAEGWIYEKTYEDIANGERRGSCTELPPEVQTDARAGGEQQSMKPAPSIKPHDVSPRYGLLIPEVWKGDLLPRGTGADPVWTKPTPHYKNSALTLELDTGMKHGRWTPPRSFEVCEIVVQTDGLIREYPLVKRDALTPSIRGAEVRRGPGAVNEPQSGGSTSAGHVTIPNENFLRYNASNGKWLICYKGQLGMSTDLIGAAYLVVVISDNGKGIGASQIKTKVSEIKSRHMEIGGSSKWLNKELQATTNEAINTGVKTFIKSIKPPCRSLEKKLYGFEMGSDNDKGDRVKRAFYKKGIKFFFKKISVMQVGIPQKFLMMSMKYCVSHSNSKTRVKK